MTENLGRPGSWAAPFFAQDGNPGQPKILGEGSLLFLLSLCRLLSHCFLCLCLPFFTVSPLLHRGKNQSKNAVSVWWSKQENVKSFGDNPNLETVRPNFDKSKYPRAKRPRIFWFCRSLVRLFRGSGLSMKANVNTVDKYMLTVYSENTCRKRKL